MYIALYIIVCPPFEALAMALSVLLQWFTSLVSSTLLCQMY